MLEWLFAADMTVVEMITEGDCGLKEVPRVMLLTDQWP
jgi:hypothetical protein